MTISIFHDYQFFANDAGFETARCLASHGCHVILACRDNARGMYAVKAIQEKHVCVLHLTCDQS